MKKQLTYREQIQALIDQMNHIYDAAGNLRDFATEEEKDAWNQVRKVFYSDVQSPLRKLDNSLTQARAKDMIPDYSTYPNRQTEMF